MNVPQPAKPKRSTMACIHCRERKVKCDNNNDGLACERCKKNKKDCRFEPVTAVTDSQQSPSMHGEPPMTGDKPIMTVYQDSSPSTSPPPPVAQWPEIVDPHLRPFAVDAQGRSLHLPYDAMHAPSLNYQPPQAYPHDQYPVGPWQQHYVQPHPTQSQFPYGHQQGENPYPATGHAYWSGTRASNVSDNNSGDRPEDSAAEPSGSS